LEKGDLVELGDHFHVGPLAILRSLLENGLTTPEYYKDRHQAEKINTGTYDLLNFKSALQEIKNVLVKQPQDFTAQLQLICASFGVIVVFTPCLPKTNIHGSTRGLNDNPLIQLSNFNSRNDVFWFTFFHEAGHIVKHRKKDVFVEGLEMTKEELIKEQEADEFATKYILTS
jgi:HTH-type transcriptional regulator/antitoxin HigA